MKRKSSTSISISPKVRCLKVYPVKGTKKDIAELKTVGIRLSKDQAIHLARVLLAVTQDWETIEITAYRLKEIGGYYPITVTSYSLEET